jgi:RND family efflux transporter MFP subunit
MGNGLESQATETATPPRRPRLRGITYFLRFIACVFILFMGWAVSKALIAMGTPPAQLDIVERPISVTVQEVHTTSVPVVISGYGQARPRDVVRIAPDVSGTVVAVHSKLHVGEVIPAGEMMFEIDARDYQARYDEMLASIRQWENTVERLRKQYAIDTERLKTFERSRELARAEFDRLRTLYEEDQVGTQSNVDNAELAYNSANDAYDQLAQQVALMPLRIEEAEATLASTQAVSALAKANLDRTRVLAPFDARITELAIKQGAYVTPGTPAVTVADDSILEISVPLNSREARNWLRFDSKSSAANLAWFNGLKQVPVELAWTEDPRLTWHGTLDRVERFDEETRTLFVVARIGGRDARDSAQVGLPLVDGMFCTVRIPGRTAENVIPLPAEAVGFERDEEGYRTAYVAVLNSETGEYRLRRRKVRESHIDNNQIYIAEGLKDGELAVVTRLVNPLENALLNVRHEHASEAGS